MLIMCGDTQVACYNFDTREAVVNNEQLLPLALKGRFKNDPTFTTESERYKATQRERVHLNNSDALIDWLYGRTLSLSRKNAKKLCNLIKASQSGSPFEKAKLSIVCKAVSVLDNYWVKGDTGKETWDGINIRHNQLNDIVAQVALHGRSLTLQGSLVTPEYSTNGAYAKAWRRIGNTLVLYKRGDDGNTESRIEIMVSKLLDKMNVLHVPYEAAEDGGTFVCACPAMTTDKLSIVSGLDFVSYYNRNNMNPDRELLKLDAESVYKMAIVDYLIANPDRHGQNWGLYMNADTCELIGCHLLFDHNNAFDIEVMQDEDAPYVFSSTDTSIKEAAMNAMKHVDFHFTAPIVTEDFITQRQYRCFMQRAKELGIKTVTTPTVKERYMKKYNITDQFAETLRLIEIYQTSSESVLWEKVANDLL